MNPLLQALVAAGLIDQATAERVDRQLDPTAARNYAEATLQSAMQGGLSAQQSRLLTMIRNAQGNPTTRIMNQIWQDENDHLYAAIQPAIADVASERAVVASINADMPDTWQLVNQQLLDWADNYYISEIDTDYGSVPNLNATARSDFLEAFMEWQVGVLPTDGLNDGLPQLIIRLEPIFGPTRASNIAITETSRIFAQAERAAALADPDIEYLQFLTSADETVCPICAPGNNQIAEKGSDTFPDGGTLPPRHPRCRCSIVSLTSAVASVLSQRGD